MRLTKKVLAMALVVLLINSNTEAVLAVKTPSEKEEVASVTTDTSEVMKNANSRVSDLDSGISQLYREIQALQADVGFSQYKDEMSKNGLDIDSVKARNIDAIQSLTSQITSLRESIEKLEGKPGYEIQVSNLKMLVENSQRIMQLLTGSNAVIAGTESYLNDLSSRVGSLETRVETLKANHEKLD